MGKKGRRRKRLERMQEMFMHGTREPAKKEKSMTGVCHHGKKTTEWCNVCDVRHGAGSQGAHTAPTPPPVEMPPEMIKEVVDHFIGVPANFNKAITYVIAEDGKLWDVRKTKIGLVCKPADKVLGAHGKMQEGFLMTIPKIPFEFLRLTVGFFRGVCDKLGNKSQEAIVQYWFDPEAGEAGEDGKPIGEYFFHVPDQQVSAGGVDHTGRHDPDGKLIHVADVHSHGRSMSAFWSGTDDRDEMRAERLYGVIGNISQTMPSMAFRARTAGAFVTLTPNDLFDMPKEPIAVRVSILDLILGRDLKASVDPFEGVIVPEDWYEKVKERNYSNLVSGSWKGGRSPAGAGYTVTDKRHHAPAPHLQGSHMGAVEDDIWPYEATVEGGKSYICWRNGEIVEIDPVKGEIIRGRLESGD